MNKRGFRPCEISIAGGPPSQVTDCLLSHKLAQFDTEYRPEPRPNHRATGAAFSPCRHSRSGLGCSGQRGQWVPRRFCTWRCRDGRGPQQGSSVRIRSWPLPSGNPKSLTNKSNGCLPAKSDAVATPPAVSTVWPPAVSINAPAYTTTAATFHPRWQRLRRSRASPAGRLRYGLGRLPGLDAGKWLESALQTVVGQALWA